MSIKHYPSTFTSNWRKYKKGPPLSLLYSSWSLVIWCVKSDWRWHHTNPPRKTTMQQPVARTLQPVQIQFKKTEKVTSSRYKNKEICMPWLLLTRVVLKYTICSPLTIVVQSFVSNVKSTKWRDFQKDHSTTFCLRKKQSITTKWYAW